MSLDVLVPLLTYPDPTPVDGLLRAVDFAATIEGRLTIATHVVDIPPITNPLAARRAQFEAMSASAEERSSRTAEQLASDATHFAKRFQIEIEHETLRCRPDALQDRLAALARTHDFSLFAYDAAAPGHNAAAQGLLFGSGGPVVLFPPGAATHLETVVVAWDGGRSAARAVRDALPVLRLSRRVVLLTVSDDKAVSPESIAAVRRFLGGHGVVTGHNDVRREADVIGDDLQAHALTHDAGLLVMGGYGHSRLREFVLGGATRSVLERLQLPVLMSH
jgi:nucleotide-binding universal stress UspA family protein